MQQSLDIAENVILINKTINKQKTGKQKQKWGALPVGDISENPITN